MWRKANPHAVLVEWKIGAVTLENCMKFPQKIKKEIELSYDTEIPLLGTYLQKSKTPIPKKCARMFITALFTIDKIWEQQKCPSVDEWIKKMSYIHTEKDKCHLTSLTCAK